MWWVDGVEWCGGADDQEIVDGTTRHLCVWLRWKDLTGLCAMRGRLIEEGLLAG